MKTIGERISIEKHKEHTTYVISTKIERWQEGLILAWVIAWTFCGLTFLYYFLNGSVGKDEKLILFILIIFWAYFEFRIAKIFLWRKFGIEFIRIDKDRLTIKKSIKGYGKVKEILTQQIIPNQIECIASDKQSFSKVMNNSFWSFGDGAIQIKDKSKNVYLGFQLEKEDATKLYRDLKSTIGKYQK